MLQQYLYWEAKPRPGSVVWILDDDVTLVGLVHHADGTVRPRGLDYAAAISELKRTGHSIVLGEVTGDPPLPILSCVRTQLVDLYHNLHQLATLQPGDPYPDRGIENRDVRLDNPDYYYDLSRSGHQASGAAFLVPTKSKRHYCRAGTVRALVARSGNLGRQPGVSSAGTVVVGQPCARPQPLYQPRPDAPLMFDHQALRDFPNPLCPRSAVKTPGAAIWSGAC